MTYADNRCGGRRIYVDETIEGESSGNGNAEYLRRELEEICSSTLNEGNRNCRYDTQGCPRPSNRHYDVYATTFGTRRRRSDSCFTVMNVYENRRSSSGYYQPHPPCRVMDRAGSGNDRRHYWGTEYMYRNQEGRQECNDGACMATDDERYRREATQPPLPYWHIANAAADMKQQESGNQYNKERAAQDWDNYMAGASQPAVRPHRSQPAPQRRNGWGCYVRPDDVAHGRGELFKCGGDVRDAGACDAPCHIRPYNGISGAQRSSRRRHRSAPPQLERPFYGATEIDKSALNAINHLLKAEKELKRVQFAAGSVLPQARDYIEQVEAIHQDLKMFNTRFRELQKETNEVLEQKGARHFHFVIKGTPSMCKNAGAGTGPVR